MNKKEFINSVNEAIENIEYGNLETMNDTRKEFVSRFGAMAIFNYSRWCEMNFEKNLREGYERKTTFTSDFSIAEWTEVREHGAIINTFKRAINEWHNNIEYFAELIIAVNMKCWEHHARGNSNLSALYGELYYIAKDMYFSWFNECNEDSQQAMDYYFDYVD